MEVHELQNVDGDITVRQHHDRDGGQPELL